MFESPIWCRFGAICLMVKLQKPSSVIDLLHLEAEHLMLLLMIAEMSLCPFSVADTIKVLAVWTDQVPAFLMLKLPPEIELHSPVEALLHRMKGPKRSHQVSNSKPEPEEGKCCNCSCILIRDRPLAKTADSLQACLPCKSGPLQPIPIPLHGTVDIPRSANFEFVLSSGQLLVTCTNTHSNSKTAKVTCLKML